MFRIAGQHRHQQRTPFNEYIQLKDFHRKCNQSLVDMCATFHLSVNLLHLMHLKAKF